MLVMIICRCTYCSYVLYEVVAFSLCIFFFFKQKTAYEMRISDWSSDVCSSDLAEDRRRPAVVERPQGEEGSREEAGRKGRLSFQAFRNAEGGPVKIGRASCRERVCQYV